MFYVSYLRSVFANAIANAISQWRCYPVGLLLFVTPRPMLSSYFLPSLDLVGFSA